MRTLLRVVAALVLAAAVASGTVHAKTFTYANQGDALSMDPHMFNEALLLNFTGNLYEALVGRAGSFSCSRSSPPTGSAPRQPCGASTCARA
jgi:ABC-type oligopeptide transport system substrate-binding subunit